MADCILTLDVLDPEDNPVANGALGIAPAERTDTGAGVMVADEQLYELSDPFNTVTLVQGATYRFREYKPSGATFYADIPAAGTEDYSDLVPSPWIPVTGGIFGDSVVDAVLSNPASDSYATLLEFVEDHPGPQGPPGSPSLANEDALVLSGINGSDAAVRAQNATALLDAHLNGEEWTYLWPDLAGVQAGATCVALAGGLYTTGALAGALKEFLIAPGEKAHVAAIQTLEGGGTGDSIYLLVDMGVAGRAADLAPLSLGIGITSTGHQPTYLRGSSLDVAVQPQTVLVGPAGASWPTGDTDFLTTIDMDAKVMTLSIREIADDGVFYTATFNRATFDAAYPGGITNLGFYLTDSRGAVAGAANHFGPVAATHTLMPTRDRDIFDLIDGRANTSWVTTNPAETIATEAWRISRPKTWDPRKKITVIINAHQSVTGTHSNPWYETRFAPLTEDLGDANVMIAAAYDHGDRWGNAPSLANYQALYDYLVENVPMGSLFFLCESMGGLPVLNLIGRRDMPNADGAIFLEPATSIENVYNTQPTLQASIRTAYDVAPDGSDLLAKIAGYEPTDREGWEYRGTPMMFLSSAADVTAPTSWAQDIIDIVEDFTSEASLVMKSGPHLDPSVYSAPDILGFIDRHAGRTDGDEAATLIDYLAGQADDIGPAATVTKFTATAAAVPYPIDTDMKVLRIRIQGPGAGGGSGRRGAAGTIRCGGGGGAGGAYTEAHINVADLVEAGITTLYVNLAAPGVGGAAPTADDTSGTAGTAGGQASVCTTAAAFAFANALLYANGGGGGGGGTAAAGTGGALVTGGYTSGGGAAAAAAGTAGGPATWALNSGQGGSSGGGLTAANAQSAGGGGVPDYGRYSVGTVAGAAGGSAGADGNGINPPFLNRGFAGAGGGSSAAGGGGRGGDGGYGAGGGGGGGGFNGFTGGRGGHGGPGFIEITAIP